MKVFQSIKRILDENQVKYNLTEHKAVRTSEEAAKIRGVDLASGAKAMVVKSKADYFLLVLPADKKIDWKKVKSLLKVKEIRFATEEEAEKVASVKMGSVPPLGNILGLQTFFDEGITKQEVVNFNPGSKTHSISMKSSDLVMLVNPTLAKIAS